MPLAEQKTYYTEADYYNLPEDVRAEIFNGEIYYKASPNQVHQKISMELSKIISIHIDENDGQCEVFAAPFDVKLSEDPLTIVQPDIMIICDRNKLDGKRCNGAPDFIIEIVSPSNSNDDYIRKLFYYKTYGVKEYWIVDPMEERIVVYQFKEPEVKMNTCTFQDKIKVNLYDELYIDFSDISRKLYF